MDELALIGAGVNALGGVLGGLGKNHSIKKQMRALSQRQRQNEAWYNRNINEDATQRADAQRMITLTEESIKKRNKAAAGAKAVMGGTDESTIATQEAGNKALADVTSKIAAAAQNRKDAIENEYMRRTDAVADAMADVSAQKKNGMDFTADALLGLGEGLKMGIK